MTFKYSLLLCCIFSAPAYAKDAVELSMEEFYQIEKYQQMYDSMVENGQLEKAKTMLKGSCLAQAKDAAAQKTCACTSDVIDKTDDKVVFYDSIVSYELFQAKVNAKKAGDENEYQRLQSLDHHRQGLEWTIDQACGEEVANHN